MSHFIELTREDTGAKIIVNEEHITHVCCREPNGSTIHLVADQVHPKGIQVKECFPHLHEGKLKQAEIVPSDEEVAASAKAKADAKAEAKAERDAARERHQEN